MLKSGLAFICFFIALVPKSVAQNSVLENTMYWLKYYNKIEFSQSWSLHTEIELRRYFLPERAFNMMMPRIHLHKMIFEGMELSGGLGYFRAALPSDPLIDVVIVVPEIRPHQEILLFHKIAGVPVSHRYRLEERFIHNNNGLNLTNGYFYRLRLRYRLAGIIKLSKSADFPLSIIVSDEVHLNLSIKKDQVIYDQNRLSLGVKVKILPLIDIDLVYINLCQQLDKNQNFSLNHILSMTVNHKILGHK